MARAASMLIVGLEIKWNTYSIGRIANTEGAQELLQILILTEMRCILMERGPLYTSVRWLNPENWQFLAKMKHQSATTTENGNSLTQFSSTWRMCRTDACDAPHPSVDTVTPVIFS